jgi:hypothetical protein
MDGKSMAGRDHDHDNERASKCPRRWKQMKLAARGLGYHAESLMNALEPIAAGGTVRINFVVALFAYINMTECERLEQMTRYFRWFEQVKLRAEQAELAKDFEAFVAKVFPPDPPPPMKRAA